MDWEEAFALSSTHINLDTPFDTIINITNHQGNVICMTVVEIHDLVRFMMALSNAVDKCLEDFVQGFKYNCPVSILTPDNIYTIKTFMDSIKSKGSIVSYYISSTLGYVDVKVFNGAITRYDATGRPLLN